MFLAGEIFSGYPVNYALGERKKEREKASAVEVCTLLVCFPPPFFFLLSIFPSLTWRVRQESLILVLMMLPLFSSVSLGHGTFRASVPHL